MSYYGSMTSGRVPNLSTNLNQQSRNPIPQSSPPPHLFFKTQFVIKPRLISMKSPPSSGSYRTRAKAAIGGDVCERTEVTAGSSTLYELLGISESDTLPEIKRAYKQLARRYHPDVSPPERLEEYTKRFIQVKEAYETLSDPKTRALYDRDMANGLHFACSSSSRRRSHFDQGFEESGEWKNRWESQLEELRRKSDPHNDSSKDMSWGARMRRQRSPQS